MNWTKEQWDAIQADNGTVLVSAAAGSGKTAVLVERVIRLIREGGDLSRMLIVTCTRAAAAEMRERIAAALEKERGNPHVYRQRRRIDAAIMLSDEPTEDKFIMPDARGKCPMFDDDGSEREFIDSLPYPLTKAQERCVREITADLISSKPMNRLIQGDVGSGKTAVAQTAMFKAVRSGYQAVMMAPTEILARQHYEGISRDFDAFGIKTGFLSGSMKASEKRQVLEDLANGSVQVLIGTHAVIQPDVVFDNLGLVITDEQHRFGVSQRIKLKDKGDMPNVLVMTATPIPRTLAVVLYGDMDVSVIDEMPPGRIPIITRCLTGDGARDKCYDFVERQIRQGRQAYVVTPLIGSLGVYMLFTRVFLVILPVGI